jgi:hypothetical protein
LTKILQCCRNSTFVYCLFRFSKTLTKPSPVNEEILQIRFIQQNEDITIKSKIWLTPNFVALSHSFRNRVLTDFMIPCLFIYFDAVLSPEYLVMLFPINEALTTFDWPFNFFFVFFILKVMFLSKFLFLTT